MARKAITEHPVLRCTYKDTICDTTTFRMPPQGKGNGPFLGPLRQKFNTVSLLVFTCGSHSSNPKQRIWKLRQPLIDPAHSLFHCVAPPAGYGEIGVRQSLHQKVQV